jgi:hypothetical protein
MAPDFPYDVFLSHSAKNQPVVPPLAERLQTCRAEAAGRRRKDGLEYGPQPSTLNPQPTAAPLNHARHFTASLHHSSFILHPFLNGSLAQFFYIN